MRKLLLIGGVLIFLGLFASKGYAKQMMMQNNGMMGMSNRPMGMMMWKIKKDFAAKCKDAMIINDQMKKLRMQTIQSDPKLKMELNRIMVLQKKLYKDTSAKLMKNPKYKNLKHWQQIISKELKKDIITEMRLKMQMVNKIMQKM
ncbi:MAG: hypothetical protein M1409_04240 [Actinobacteria bacterium]|nr:hypothetical protein [Actinomycetota bacterium]